MRQMCEKLNLLKITMKKTLSYIIAIALTLSFSAAYAQTATEVSHEISSSVPELSSMYKVIQPMWHKAYPAKDIATLKAYVPQIKEYMAAINSAKLSGILREKESAWKSELVKFNKTADAYYKAAAGSDDNAMLVAAEDFHKAYEAMNRVVRPFVKEMDEFHKTLYVIYHKSLPEKKYGEIAKVMETFAAQADAITKYPQEKLEKRLKDKTPKYYTVSNELKTAVADMASAMKGNNDKKKDAAIENVHKYYQRLEAIFE